MTDENNQAPLDLGVYGRLKDQRIANETLLAAILSIVWLIFIAVFWVFLGSPRGESDPISPLMVVFTLLSIFLPIGLVWVAATLARTSKVMREEAHRLQQSIDAMRHAYLNQQHSGAPTGNKLVEKKLGEIAATQKQTATAIATFASRRERPETPPTEKAALPKKNGADVADDNQTTFALGTLVTDLREPISVAEFIRALNFPENEDDKEGFRTLRRALEDRESAKMIRSSQDVLTLLSQDGIYMDDLRPDKPKPHVWRRFAHGERGQNVTALGGIRDRSCLALASGRMKKDPVFRDVAHHFLRQFDQVLTEFEPNATDEDLVDMGETRTARAFMLLGRVTGSFN